MLGRQLERCSAMYVSCVGIDVAPFQQYSHDPLMPIHGSTEERRLAI